jgi:hypothetical protein
MPTPSPSLTPATKNDAKAARRAKATAQREAAQRAERRRLLILRGSIAAVVLGLVAAITLVFVTAAHPSPAALPTPPAAAGATPPPWPAPADPTAGIARARLSISAMSAGGAHFHPHLDIRVDGKAVPVTPNIGVNAASGAMSELHTHDASGVLHIESDQKSDRYVLGQLFTEWGVRLDRTHLGSLTTGGGRTLAAYVDGKRFRGNPAQIELLPHREVALVYGTAAQQKNPPSTYNFQPGD